MARFRATIQGQRGIASRLGSERSGLSAHVNGWHVGVNVEAGVENGKDVLYVYRTGGSGSSGRELIATVVEGAETELHPAARKPSAPSQSDRYLHRDELIAVPEAHA